jgi:hypothetical protein
MKLLKDIDINKIGGSMNMKRSKITLENLQVKSIEKAKKLAHALEIIEEECGIHEVEINIKGFFLCPWINVHELDASEMEKILAEIFIKAR